MAARGLAPRRTPGALRLARHSATAYSATLDVTVDRLRGALRPEPLLGGAHGPELAQGELPPAVLDEPGLGVGVGVADGRRQREPVELALDERVGAELGEGVLGGDDEVGARQRPRLAVHAHLLLLHRLEQGGLGARRGAVELVDEHDVGEHRARAGTPTCRCRARTPTPR